jgi:hypothetical protein
MPKRRREAVNRTTKGIIVSGAAALLASFVAPIPAHAEVSTQGMPAKCYQWPTDRVEVTRWDNGVMHTDQIQVTLGSPCKDINVRGVVDVDGKNTCRKLRVVYGETGRKGRWHRACKRWVVLHRNATEGDTFTIEAQGRPSSVVVRS